MHTTAVFMGAGASKSFGFPLTGELLPLIKREIDANTLFEDFADGPRDASRLNDYLRALIHSRH
jgi:hypothetical protein